MKKIIFTIDAEVWEKARFTSNGFDKNILWKTLEWKDVWVLYIWKQLNKHWFKWIFFLDPYSYKFYWEKKYEKICKKLINQWHDIQLHTHPSSLYDLEKKWMHNYTIDMQIKIIKKWKKMLEKWTWKKIIAHRAWNYWINENTFKALANNWIYQDYSYFHNNSNCKISLDINNEISIYNWLKIIPITQVNILKKYSLFNKVIFSKKRNQKIDINWNQYLSESIDAVSKNKSVITFFMHSNSFILNPKKIVIFGDILKKLSKEKFKSIQSKDIWNINISNNYNKSAKYPLVKLEKNKNIIKLLIKIIKNKLWIKRL